MTMRWWDVSRLVGPELAVYPGDPVVEVETVLDGQCGPVHLSAFRCGTHTGTHVDAPAHVMPQGQPLTALPVEAWSGPAWVLQLPPGEDPISAAHLVALWPHPAQPDPVQRVLLRSANSGFSQAAAPLQPLSLGAAHWLVAQGVLVVGTDALSIEADETGALPVHHALLGAGVQLVEGLDLAAIQPGPYEFICLPLRLDLPDGAPARAALRRPE